MPSFRELGHEAFRCAIGNLHIRMREETLRVDSRAVIGGFIELNTLDEFHSESRGNPTERLPGDAGRDKAIQGGAERTDKADFKATAHLASVADAPVHRTVNI